MTPGSMDEEKLFAARLHAVRNRPYLATALFALHTVESPQVPMMTQEAPVDAVSAVFARGVQRYMPAR